MAYDVVIQGRSLSEEEGGIHAMKANVRRRRWCNVGNAAAWKGSKGSNRRLRRCLLFEGLEVSAPGLRILGGARFPPRNSARGDTQPIQ